MSFEISFKKYKLALVSHVFKSPKIREECTLNILSEFADEFIHYLYMYTTHKNYDQWSQWESVVSIIFESRYIWHQTTHIVYILYGFILHDRSKEQLIFKIVIYKIFAKLQTPRHDFGPFQLTCNSKFPFKMKIIWFLSNLMLAIMATFHGIMTWFTMDIIGKYLAKRC